MVKKILVADDDQDLVATLREHLTHEGYELVVAYEGIRTVEMAHKKRPYLSSS